MKEIINDPETCKVVATVNKDGEVHAVFKDNVFANDDDQIILCEIIESSITNKNLVNSIWFEKKVCFNFLTPGRESYLILCRPIRVAISGKEFQYYYRQIKDVYGDIDLSGVWIFQVTEIKKESLKERWIEEQECHPIVKHLDRILCK